MRGLVLVAALASCSFNHGVAPGQGGGDGTVTTGGDGGATGDGTITTGACTTAGQRVCIDSMHSGSCTGAMQAVIDRTCPPTSMCVAGYCQPPVVASACSKASDCTTGSVCDLYVVSGMLVGFCTTPFGATNTDYQSCSPLGNDTTCQTGLCAHDDDGHQQCLVPCTGGDNSTCPSGHSCHSLTDPTTIEGQSTSAQYACFN